MQPQLSPPVPAPKGRGEDARVYLEAHGIKAVTPKIRSSDYEMIRACPFQYYLARRLGIHPFLQYSEALSRGSWFHLRAQHIHEDPPLARNKFQQAVGARCMELEQLCKKAGVELAKREKILEKERRDAWSAYGWWDAMWDYRIDSLGCTTGQYLTKPYWRCLATELELEHDGCVATLDALLYHQDQNSLWIVDYKTTSDPTGVRLATCPIEFQTQHYIHVVDACREQIAHWHTLPDDVRVGGMLHIAVQKPTISFSAKDRPFEEYEHEISRGPRKGTIEIRRRYMGEPSYELYLERCQRWYRAEGEYLDQAQRRLDDPPINISRTPASLVFDTVHKAEYSIRLASVEMHSEMEANPELFVMSASYLRSYGQLNPYSPFYLCPVHQWPDIIAQENFVISHRDQGT